MNVQDEIKALKERIAELERQQEFPQDGDRYWYIDDYGYILNEKWDGRDFEEFRLETGNFFKTEEQANFTVEKLKVETELRNFSRPFESGEDNYHIIFNTSRKFTGIFSAFYRQSQGIIYFESLEKAQQAVSTVGEDRIKKYLFGVED